MTGILGNSWHFDRFEPMADIPHNPYKSEWLPTNPRTYHDSQLL